MILYLDTETTGLPPKGASWRRDADLFPHVVQIAWYTNKMKDVLIKPDGWTIPDDAVKIHGISNNKATMAGIDIKIAMAMLLKDAKKADHICGHNVFFDTSMILSTAMRYNLDMNEWEPALHKDKRICTSNMARKIYGWTTLVSLYQRLFLESFDAHNAVNDVLACKRCYEELLKRYPDTF